MLAIASTLLAAILLGIACGIMVKSLYTAPKFDRLLAVVLVMISLLWAGTLILFAKWMVEHAV